MSRTTVPSKRRLMSAVERVLTDIRYPQDEAGYFHHQVHQALLSTGFNVIREVSMDGAGSNARRIDLVVVDRAGVLAIELDHQDIPQRTAEKFRDLPEEVLRMVVLRDRHPPLLKAPNVDRVVCLRSDLRAVDWLNTGHPICEEMVVPRLIPNNELALSRAYEAGEARRLISGPRKPAKNHSPRVAPLLKKAGAR